MTNHKTQKMDKGNNCDRIENIKFMLGFIILLIFIAQKALFAEGALFRRPFEESLMSNTNQKPIAEKGVSFVGGR